MTAKVPFNLLARQGKSSKQSFGEVRAKKMEDRLKKAIVERRKIAAAEQSSDDPLKTHLQKKGTLVERSIARMQHLLGK